MTEIKKKIILETDKVVLGELTFKHENKTKIKNYVELKRRVVLVVPVNESHVYLLKEYRPLLGETVWRVCAGTLDEGEDPKKGAIRELLEETGFTADEVSLLNSYQYMGWVKFPIYLFKAEGLHKQKQQLDFYERINLVKVTRKKAMQIALNEMPEPHHAFAVLKCLN